MRLRPPYTADELRQLYPVPHDHTAWPDHRLRVELTVALLKWMEPTSIADLSCGDGAVANAFPWVLPRFLGDLAPGHPFHGPIEDTLDLVPSVDVFVCCETLEHLDDPDLVLSRIRGKARRLVLSTPDGEMTDGNPQHYWGWDREGVRHMLLVAGWSPMVELGFEVPGLGVRFQLWGCE